MTVIDGRTGLEHLVESACWELVSGRSIGRVAVLVDSAPEVYPVNFAVDRGSIVFRTSPGSKLRGLVRSPTVCFEVDDIDGEGRTGWSVLVKGRAEEVVRAERQRLEKLPLELWVPGPKSRWIRIRPAEVTGRRIFQA